MNIVVAFRKHFGLSQSNLAFYLGISVSLLKMVEIGKRELPISALSAFANLQHFATNLNGETGTLNRFADTGVKSINEKAFRKQLSKLDEQLQRATGQLVELTQRRQRLANKTALVAYLRETAQTAGKETNIWLRILEAEIAVENDRWSKEDELLLQWQIDGYSYTIEQGNRLLQEMKEEK